MINRIINNIIKNNKGGEVYFSPPEKRSISTDNKIISSRNKKGK
nr:MAG TPA: hypothetical protein [Caudoviricetes sp.]